jgi:AcrR family transcriptional regulator
MTLSPPRTPTRSYRGVSASERVAERRARFIAAGLELFGTRGYQGTGVKDICREAGLTDRYFYESFRDSEALLVAVFDQLTEQLFGAVAEAVVAAGPEAEAQLRAAITTFVDALAADPRGRRVVFVEAAAVGGEAERHMRATLRRFAQLVAATALPHLGGDTEQAHVVALSLVGTLERVAVEWHDGELGMPIERVVDRCVALYLAVFGGAPA